jgi:hypothetical protein
MYQVYQLRENASVTLNLLYSSLERKVKWYNNFFFFFINEHVFHTEEYDHCRKTYNNRICVNESTFNEFEVDYYGKLEEVIEL